MIEQYRQALMEFSRKHPRNTPPEPQPEPVGAEPEPEERILPATGLVREDLEMSETVLVTTEMRRQNMAQRERADVPQTTAAAAPPLDNEAEQEFVQDGDEFPPYLNGSIEQFPDEADFLQNNPESGFLRVQVFAANQSFPIQNATVVVRKRFPGKDKVFFTAQTDSNGIMNRITLPAPDRELADAPSALQPYSTYDVLVSHPRFIQVIVDDVAVFDSVETVQNVEMIPCMPDDDMGREA